MRSSLLTLAALGVGAVMGSIVPSDTTSSFFMAENLADSAASISLELQVSGRQELDPQQARAAVNSQIANLLVKHGLKTKSEQPQKRQSAALVAGAINKGEETYYAQISVGTPAQKFLVMLDTGSDDAWLMDAACGKECDGIAKFNGNASSTYVATELPIGIEFGTGKVQGRLATDTFSLAGYQIPSQPFAVMDQVDRSVAVIAPGSGMMGLPLTSEAAEAGTPFWLALARSRKIASPLFTLRLARQKWNQGAPKPKNKQAKLSPGGNLTFGIVDATQFSGPVTYINVIPNSGWSIPLESIKLDGKVIRLPNTATDATIDSGTALLVAPRSVTTAVYAQIPGSERRTENVDPSTDVYSIPCDISVRVSLGFGGKDWVIDPADITTEAVGKGKEGKEHCIGAIFGLSEDAGLASWIIGTPFLKNVFSVFDGNFGKGSARIGFAQLKGLDV